MLLARGIKRYHSGTVTFKRRLSRPPRIFYPNDQLTSQDGDFEIAQPKPDKVLVVPHSAKMIPGFGGILKVPHKIANELRDMQKKPNDEHVVGLFYRSADNAALRPTGVFAKVSVLPPLVNEFFTMPRHENNFFFNCLHRIQLQKKVANSLPMKAHVTHEEPIHTVKTYETTLIEDTIRRAAMNRFVNVDSIDNICDYIVWRCGHSHNAVQSYLAEYNVDKRAKLALDIWHQYRAWKEGQARLYDHGKSIPEVIKVILGENRNIMDFVRQDMKQLRGSVSDARSSIEEEGQEEEEKEEETSNIPEHVQSELKKLRREVAAARGSESERHSAQKHLEFVESIPWGEKTVDSFDLKVARDILEDKHYGLEKVKRRIMEHVAVVSAKRKLNPEIGVGSEKSGKVLLFVGPPGVGKTSIGESVAEALGRKFSRFSVGGLSNVSEMKGHRRTYIGARAGRLVTILTQVKSMNPVIMIDEVDKVGLGRGDGSPADALLEVLDPSQNNKFMDHYVDIPVDISDVLFICTANYFENIPYALQDRMEVIHISGYDANEKFKIARKHLEDKLKQRSAVTSPETSLSDEALNFIIEKHDHSSGIRGLEKAMDKVYRSIALSTASASQGLELSKELRPIALEADAASDKLEITREDVDKILGKPKIRDEKLYETITKPGIVMGLAVWGYTGGVLYIETTTSTGKDKKLQITGSLSKVMGESTQLALVNARQMVETHYPENKFFETENKEIRLHAPSGAIPKDGPSAGIAMTSALISLAIDKPIPADIAMTGEISLTGRVLQVGGIKEKLLGAKRDGVKRVIVPAGNKIDVEELSESLRQSLDIRQVETYDEVYKILFQE